MSNVFNLQGTINIDTSGFITGVNNAYTSMNNLYLLVQQFNNQFGPTTTNNTTNATNQTVNNLNNVGNTVNNAGNAIQQGANQANQGWTVFRGVLSNLATYGVTKAMNFGKSFLQTGFEFNQNMEKWTASFKTYLGGNAEAAAEFMEEVRQFAIETPLSLSDSVQASVRLMASGIEKSEVIDTLRMIGDIANGDTQKMSRLALVYSQVMAAKKLKGNDPNQFKEAGVPIYDLLLDYYHANGYDYIDAAFLQEMQAKGGITSDEVYGALKMATSEGGMFYNAMNNIMGTEYGEAQKMLDNYEQASGSFTKAIFEIFKSDTIPALNEILNKLNTWATENPEALKKLGEAFNNLATGGIDLLVSSLTGLIDLWNENSDIFSAMLVFLGGFALTRGHGAAGLALIAAGGYPVFDEKRKELSGLTSDVNLPFVKEQLEYQGAGENWEAYLESWKKARKDEGYSDADITAFIDKQFAEYKPSTSNDLSGLMPWVKTSGDSDDGGFSLWRLLFPRATDGLLTNLLTDWLSDDDNAESDGTSGRGFTNPYGLFGGTSGSTENTSILGMLAAMATLPAQIKEAASSGVAEGVGSISITGTITTGDVTLDTGTVVGQLAPRLNLTLGHLNTLSSRG